MKRQAQFDGSKMLKCDYRLLANDQRELRECAENCHGTQHVREMQYAHILALCNQRDKGMESSFRTLAYTHSHALSFTHLH
jgi:hypothetical protein